MEWNVRRTASPSSSLGVTYMQMLFDFNRLAQNDETTYRNFRVAITFYASIK